MLDLKEEDLHQNKYISVRPKYEMKIVSTTIVIIFANFLSACLHIDNQ